jgi:hypothetical protein
MLSLADPALRNILAYIINIIKDSIKAAWGRRQADKSRPFIPLCGRVLNRWHKFAACSKAILAVCRGPKGTTCLHKKWLEACDIESLGVVDGVTGFNTGVTGYHASDTGSHTSNTTGFCLRENIKFEYSKKYSTWSISKYFRDKKNGGHVIFNILEQVGTLVSVYKSFIFEPWDKNKPPSVAYISILNGLFNTPNFDYIIGSKFIRDFRPEKNHNDSKLWTTLLSQVEHNDWSSDHNMYISNCVIRILIEYYMAPYNAKSKK